MKILVADDSKTNLLLLKIALENLGHEVITASSGQEVIDFYQNNHPDLVILDVVMGSMSGFECAKKIRELEFETWIPIIFLSAMVNDASISQSIDAGGDDYLTKPFSIVTLSAKVRAMQRISDMRKKLYDTTCQLKVLTSTDILTGLYNRLQFNKTLREKIAYANRHNSLLALLFLDLDNFKFVNDHLGHSIGDSLLKEVAHRLTSHLRQYDFIARLGGDEFAVILNDIRNTGEAGSVSQKILDALSKPLNIAANNINISCSIGVACYPFAGTEPDTIVKNADIAMYRAKELGRNNYQYFTKELFEKYKKQIEIEDALKSALTHNEIFILYDPIFNLQTRQCVGFEASIRWNNEQFGLLEPEKFASIAEQVGITPLLDTWTLKTVCTQYADWLNSTPNKLPIAVSISQRQLLRKDFISLLTDILSETKLPASLLEIELKETTIITYSNLAENTIIQLSEMGIKIIIDDFGVGYSSLVNLKNFPINCLKINKTFIHDIAKNPNNEMIIKSIINLGSNMNIKIIAKGVDKKRQFDFLISQHCQLGQGKYLSEPLDEKQVKNLLQSEINFEGQSK